MDETHDRLKELVAPYVLGAVPRNEMAFVRAHILSCDDCMTEADAFAQVAEKLPLVVQPVALPDGFTERVLAAASAAPSENSTIVTDQAETPTQNVVSLAEGRRPRFVSVMAAAAVLLAFAVMTTSLLQTRQDLQRQETAVSALLRAGDESMGLQGTSGAVAKMVASNGHSSLVVAGLRAAPQNHTYQLWIQQEGEMKSAGTFDVEEGVAVLDTEWDLDEYEGAAITIEPSGGSPQPTSQPILATFAL